jgi:hypothetical protein
MNTLRALLTFIALLAGTSLSAQETLAEATHFGEAFPLETSSPLHSVAAVMADTGLHGTPITIAGTVTDVCQKKGCWMVVSDGTSQMRITFKDYGFFVPIDSQNRQVAIRGVVTVEELSEDLAKHYAEESKGEDPDAIRGPQRVITMVATGVRIVN